MDHFINAFATLFVTINVLGVLPVFVAMVTPYPAAEQRKIALRSNLLCFLVLLVFALGGEPFLRLLGISLPAFQMGGGILLFFVGFEMVFDRRNQSKAKAAQKTKDAQGEDLQDWQSLAIFPLAVPLLAGAGTMTVLILLSAEAPIGTGDFFLTLAALSVVMLISTALHLMAAMNGNRMNPQLTNIITRLMGVILVALSAQYVIDGYLGIARL